MRGNHAWLAASLVTGLVLTAPEVSRKTAQAEPAARQAKQLLAVSGVRGGLVVHVGCGDGHLTAALHVNDRYLVQGLDVDPKAVAGARQHIRSLGLYGPVSAVRFDGRRLPYVDELVNLLVVERPGELSRDEMLRVLAPGGVLCVRREGRWQRTVKPWPEDIDQWTHYLHDASNNAVARDRRLGPPRRLKWTCGPLWTRSHEFTSSLVAMVSGGGRVFYVFDEGLTSLTDAPLPDRWVLIARDAFNGVPLWKRPLPSWGPKQWGRSALRSIPPTVPRRLVVEGDRVFMTLAYDAPVSILDAATGEVLSTLPESEGTEELRCVTGVLLLCKPNRELIAIDAGTNQRLWEVKGKIQRVATAATPKRVFYQDGSVLVCRGLRDGREQWRTSIGRAASLVVVHGDRLIVLGGKTLQAFDADSGQKLWSVAARPARPELFVAQGKVWHWVGDQIVGRDLQTGELAVRLNTDDVFTPGHHLRCYQTKATERYLITPNRGAEFVSLTDEPNCENDWIRGACRYGVMPANGLLYVPPNPCFCYPGVKLTGFNALAPSGKPQRPSPGDPDRLERGPAYGMQTASGVPKGKRHKPREKRGEQRSATSPEGQHRIPDCNLQFSMHSSGLHQTATRKLAVSVHPTGFSRPSTLNARPATDWPTYRHDARRSGATSASVPADVKAAWRVKLDGRLTPPVVADGRVYVAVKERHTLYALALADGRRLWEFIADGPIDSPPTISGGRVLFGCADGRVYCLRATDGALAWRFRAAPKDRRIVAFGQLESPWRVHGSVLVEDGIVYCTAGRSTYLDGGLWLWGLDAQTGQPAYQAHLDTWARTRKDWQGKPFIPGYHMEGAQSDILVSEGGYLFLGQYKFDRRLRPQAVPYILPQSEQKTVALDPRKTPYSLDDLEPDGEYERRQREWLERTQRDLLARLRRTFGGYSLGARRMGRHLLTTAGFLDDSWFNRTYWMYSAVWPGYYLAHRAAKTGQLLVVGPEKTYAVQAFPTRNFQSPLFSPGKKGYLLLADDNDNEPVLDSRTFGTTKGWGYTRIEPPVWFDWVPIRIRAMVLANDRLFVCGPPDVVDPDDPMAAFEGRKGSVLRAVSATDGHKLAEQRLDVAPVFDGLIATNGRLLMSTLSGEVVCLTGRPPDENPRRRP